MPETADRRRASPSQHEPAAESRERRRRVVRRLTALGAGVSVVFALLLAAGPVARRVVVSRAAERGFVVDVGRATLGWGVLRLADVRVSATALPGFQADLAHVEITPSLRLAPKRVSLHGATVHLDGEPDALESSFRTLLGPRGASTGSVASSDKALVTVDGVDVVWTHATRADTTQHVWGARYERSVDGRETASADLVRLTGESGSLEVVQGRVQLGPSGGSRVLRDVGAERFAATLDLDHDAIAAAKTVTTGTTGTPGTTTGPSRGSEWRERLRGVARRIAGVVPDPSKLSVSGGMLELRHAGQTLNVGPATVLVASEAGRVRLGVTSGAAGRGTPLRVEIDLPLGDGQVDARVEGGPLSLAALGVNEGDMGLADVQLAELEVNGLGTLSADGTTLSVSGRSRLSNVSVFQPRLSAEPVRGLALSLSGKADLKLDGSEARLTEVEIGIGKARLQTSGELHRAQGDAQGKLHAEMPLSACTDLLASVPRALIPLAADIQVAGTFAASGDLSFDTRRPGDTVAAWNVANDCRITQVPASVDPGRFGRPWVRAVLDATGTPTTLESGPGTAGWVPYSDLSPYLATAVVICEDANFWTHDGFDSRAIQSSIRDNLRAGRFVRGGSTVSMQLAKNLYLGREKTLARKLQEAIFTALLEQSLTKEQILELYLNLIEFAPGLYGVGPAAAHYFKTKARDLSLAQSLYLITLLPNPKISHFSADGTLSETWTEYLRHLMRIAHKVHRIDDRELEAGLAEVVHFGEPNARSGAEEGAAGSAPDDIMDLAPPDDPERDGTGP